ncbi:glycoside hydrolase family 130 protein [Flammeovirga aprica]|uniref:Glycosidase n=1 Tax=Flammeovirga aprica JL-4 TaxID=694437 RepID=A0A7X9P3X3_9BACT|nr:glycosidase [Flammeovirga aprica]NME68752.1 glycosidase [Flammeovirga aprica JL-4]
MKLTKFEGNPVLSPHASNEWENLVVCNPGAWYEDGKFYMMYRAAGDDFDHKIYFGLAESEDGFNFKRVQDQPVFSPSEDGPDSGCVEDPRIVKFGDTFYITYAYRAFPPGQYWKYSYDAVVAPEMDEFHPELLKKNIANTGLAISKDLKNFRRVGRITKPELDDRDVIIFPEKINDKYYMLHRPKEWIGEEYGTEYPAIWIQSSDDMVNWKHESDLLLKGEEWWEVKVGGNTPPVKTDEGWVMLYHGVDKDNCYRVGACLLDLEDPTKILYRTKDFIMEPEEDWEKSGLYKWGVVFPTGNVLVDDTLYIYYGGSDQYCGVATCDIHELVAFIKDNTKETTLVMD